MGACAVFGHRDYCYEQDKDKLRKGLVVLIENCGVTEFFIGMRGAFDIICCGILRQLKKEYPSIKLIRVWSYIPQGQQEECEGQFDDSVYLLERQVPHTYAIIETNKILVRKVEYIYSGVLHGWGGAWMAVEYAKKHGKTVVEPLGGY